MGRTGEDIWGEGSRTSVEEISGRTKVKEDREVRRGRRRKKGQDEDRGEQEKSLEVADVLAEHLPGYLKKHKITGQQWRALEAIRHCRTHKMGYHVRECEECGYREWQYNSCKDRHCPKCQWAEQYEWVGRRLAELPGAKYHHAIFTVPDGELYYVMIQNKGVIYEIIFKAAAETLKAFGADEKHLGARIGMIGVLHTWGQTLNYHVHVHFLVTAGGLSEDGERWIESKYGDKFLFPVRALSLVFRGKFMEKLRRAYKRGELAFSGKIEKLRDPREFERYMTSLSKHMFRVHSKPATKEPANVVKYLGGYMKRVAISNSRIVGMEGGEVEFRYKDNREEGKEKLCRMDGEEFIRRYVMHIVPKGFVRVRYYGILGGRNRKKDLEKARELIGGLMEAEKEVERYEPECPRCEKGKMVVVEHVREPISLIWVMILIMRVQYEDTS